jgi:hypothetical protein
VISRFIPIVGASAVCAELRIDESA